MATESYQGSMDGNPMDGISQVPSQGRQSSQSPGPSGKNYDNANESNPTIQPTSRSRPVTQAISSDPSSLPESHDIPIAPAFAMQEEDLNKGSPVSQFHSSPLSRSNTVRTSSDQQHNWASDRSPLQKLEVALGGISKEEKRARALEAERKLKERMAAASAKSAVNPVPPVPIAPQPGASSSSPPRSSTQKVKQPDSRNEEELENISAQPEPARERPRTARGGAPAFQPAVARPLEESQYARNKPRGTQVVKAGTVPRRSVSVNYQSDGARMAPQAPNQNQGPINRNPLSRGSVPSGPPRMPDSGQNYRQQQQQQPGHHSFNNKGWASAPSSGLQQVGTNGQPFQDLATTGPAVTNLNNPNEIWDVEKSVELGGLDKLQNSQSKPKRNTVSFNVPPPTPPPLSEWKTAPTGRLNMSDFDFQNLDVDKSKAWWEGGETQNRRQSRALPKNYQKPPAQKLTSHKRFQPLIFLKCGPLLRYTGLKRVRVDGPHGPVEKETWRGSILIVTKDSVSSYEPRPTIRLFSQPMDILPPPPAEINSEGVQLAPEYIDPTAGLMKLGRDGRPLYVKPVEHTEEELDLSLVESDDGIYEMSASAVDHNSEGTKQPIPANRIHSMDGETAGTYKEITGFRLYADSGRDVTFWRFNIEIELGEKQQRVAYRLNQGPAIGFWVPAKGQSMNIMFHSCNGFTPGVDSNKFCGPDPLWRDVLNEHQTRPFHVMIGGGDQIFNDNVIANSLHFQEWLKIKDSYDKYDAPLHVEFKAELEMSYLENYSRWFSQGLFSLASSQIPMVNIWNDHEILEGFGSYPDEFMSSPVISGLGNIAFKYYLLFQHHSVPEETEVDEPSWLLGAEPGPYINQRSRNIFLSLGGGMALLGLDCRTERMCDEILTEHTTDLIWDRCHRELTKGETKHLIVLSSIPVAYPRVAVVKNILNSRQSLGKAGLFGGFVNKHGGKVEIFDDHWTAKHHKSERTYLIEDLQDLAAEKSIRVTILSGDVHLAAIGQFYSNPSLNIPKDKDYRYMPNIIASGIADMPTTEMISDTLNRRNHVHHMDTNTDEDMIPIFTHDVNNKARNNKRLLPRRNWCSIRVYQPGSTPAATPKTEASSPTPEEPRPNMLQRTLSLTRGDRPQGGLLRRLSHKGRPPTKEFNLGGAAAGRRMSMDSSLPPAGTGESYFPPPEDFRPGPFLRRPTNLSQKAAKKAAKRENDGAGTFVNLEGGLAVTLNLELNPKDPSGITAPYKLLVPALWYDGTEYDPPAAPITKGWRKWLGMRRNNASKHSAADNNEAEYGFNDEGEEYNREGEEEVNEARAHGHGPLDDEYESDLDLEPEPDVQENPKRRKWFGRRL